MHKRPVVLLCCFLLTQPAISQNPAPTSPPATAPPQEQPAAQTQEAVPPKLRLAFGLEDGTPVRLRLARNLSSSEAKTGDTVDFEVLEDVKVKELIIIPRGGVAWATVTEAQAKRRMARGGKLDINIDNVRLVDGEKAPLRAVKEAKGGGHTGAMVGAMVATSIVFFPAAPLFLFMHGKDVTIPKGTEVTAYVNGDIPLEPARFQPDAAASPAANPAVAGNPSSQGSIDSTLATIEIKSNPDGADITVDDKFVGDTPSTLKLAAGEHKIRVEKSGFQPWEKTLTVSAETTVTVNPTLDKASSQ